MKVFEKRRPPAPPGSIPEVLNMFRSEVRFYREIAPVVGVRVPACYEATVTEEGTYLKLEDLASWSPGADPLGVVNELRGLHERWQGRATELWPWLRGPGLGADLIGQLYDRTWPGIAKRSDLTPAVRILGVSLVGRVEAAELAEGSAGPLSLCHGDTASNNLATGPYGEIAFLDWEDVRCAAGVTDLAWFLVSSVPPAQWNELEAAYGGGDVDAVLPSVGAQALFAMSDEEEHNPAALGWISQLEGVARRLRL